MKRLSKILCVMLALMICIGVLAGCGEAEKKDVSKKQEETELDKEDEQDKESKTEHGEVVEEDTGFPIVEEPITLKIMARYRQGMADFKDMLSWQEYEKLSNIKVEWIMVERQAYQEKRNLALATGDLPDAFIKCGFSAPDLLKYGQQGTFIPLNDLIENHAPNFKKILDDEENYSGVKKGLTMTDGNIYSFAEIVQHDFDAVIMQPKLFINRKWLDEVGKDMPATTDEFYDVLKAFKTDDPNKNEIQDEIPLWSDSVPTAILKGAWGLNNRGVALPHIDMDEEKGKLRFTPIDPKYKEMLEYINKLWSEELIDQEMFTTDFADLLAKGEQNLIGSFALAGNSYVGPEHQDDFEGLEVALKGPHGDQIWGTGSVIASKNAFVITSANEYPEETVRWIDYFYSDEGMKLYYMGKEGVTFRETEDGEYEFLDFIMNNPDGLDYMSVLNQYVSFAIGVDPALLSPKYFKGTQTLPEPAAAAQRMAPYAAKEVWPQFSFTLEENDQIVGLTNDIHSYVTEKNAEFITGQTPFSEWDDYVKTLEQMGLQEYMDIYQAAYERTFID